MKRYELVVFDWDGTLVDSAAHIVHSIQEASRDLALPVPTDTEARHIIGLGLADAMEYLFPGLEPARYVDVANRYRVHYLSGEERVTLFGGVRDGVAALRARGALLAVATGKSRKGLERALDTTGLRGHFDSSRCADEGFSKPHPGMLEFLLSELDIAPSRAVMVGDTTHDVEMAHAAGVASVAVTYGAHDPAKLARAEPSFTIESPEALWDWFSRVR